MKKGFILSDRYEIIDKIGEGGMVNVYLSKDLKENRLVTIKIIRLDFQGSQKAKRHFKFEKLAINKLNSDHIVQVYDLDRSDDIQYLVTEYVEGYDLKRYIQEHNPISTTEVISIMSQLIDAVNEAHQHGIIHRDLKPQNVLIDKNGVVKVTDFGIALIENQIPFTQTNAVVGSIHYISPEQALGKKATKQSDIYSLGIILYELLTGKVPFDGESPLNIAMKHTDEDIPSVIEQNHNVSQALENVVIKATAKKLDDRYNNVLEMKNDLLTSMNKDRIDEPKLHFISPKREIDNGETKVLNLNDLKKYKDDDYQEDDSNNNHMMLKQLSLILVLLIFLSGIFLFFNYTFFTRVSVPNVENLTLNQAKKELKDSHLLVSKVKYVYDSEVKANHVISTNPGIGTKMINHSSIALTVSGGYKKVKVDNYVGESIDIAAGRLAKLGFHVQQSYRYSTEFKSGTVLQQSIQPRTVANPQKDIITLTVSINTKTFKMADLIGMTEAEVKRYVKQNNLNAKYFYEKSNSQKAGRVYQQNPTTGLETKYGDNIEIWISKGIQNSKNLSHSVDVTLTIPFKDNGNGKNKITIFANQNGEDEKVYRTFYIKQSTKITIPYSLKAHQHAKYKVYRDGQLIMK